MRKYVKIVTTALILSLLLTGIPQTYWSKTVKAEETLAEKYKFIQEDKLDYMVLPGVKGVSYRQS